jgi:uncharacterized membrane protein YtjA (UPF0391 family)
MLRSAAWFVVISWLAVFFEFGGLVTDSAEMVRSLALLLLVMLLIGVVATLILSCDRRPSRPSPRRDHFRRIRSQGRAAD